MKKTSNKTTTIIWLLCIGAFLRCIFAMFHTGFISDTACFAAWASRVYEGGFSAFYSPDVFTDYPPGYMYILYIIGALSSFLKLEYLSPLHLLLLRLPAILCDLAACYVIYRMASKRFSELHSLIIAALYLFNPAVIMNSSIWGQVDSVFMLAILLMVLLLMENKNIPAYYVFAVGVLLKPQTLIFTPLLLFGIYENVFAKDFSMSKFWKNLLWGLLAIALMLLLCVPFGLDKVWNQYTDTLGSYPYISVNAYNFWALLGKNWASQDTAFLFFTYKELGTFVIVALTLISTFIFLKRMKSADRYFVAGSFIALTMFMFSVRMHERYLYPVMLMLLAAFVMTGSKHMLYSYLVLTICHFLNVWHVLNFYDPTNYASILGAISMLSLVMVFGAAYYYYSLCKVLKSKEEQTHSLPLPKMPQTTKGAKRSKKLPVEHSRERTAFTKADGFIIAFLIIFYGSFAFYNLGITKTPVTEEAVSKGSTIHLELGSKDASTLCWYLLNEQDITFSLSLTEDPELPSMQQSDVVFKSVFKWDKVTLNVPASTIDLTNITEDAVIGEIVLLDNAGNVITPVNAADYPALFDENDLLPDTFDYMSGTYFDEIYYTRTAYEMIHGLQTYENTHPPLGKDLMALCASIFGTTPFGFRFAGALFGVLMLPLMYLFGRNITQSKAIGAFIAFIFAFDFMHFTQTRLTTIDVFVVFFIIAMYYFMEQYLSLSFADTSLNKMWLPLGACGIAFGFGIASKWTGAYAGAGLALIFFARLWKDRKYLDPIKKTIGFCMIFFVAIPFVIYLLSYIPFVDHWHPGLFDRMINNQLTMFNYHSDLEATHPYSSMWYEWPTMVRPIWYFSNSIDNTMRQGISAFGNPLVWWSGIPALIYMIYLWFKKKDRTAGFLVVSYLAQFLPWTLVSRCTFIYHYFPCVPFLALMIGYSFKQLKGRMKDIHFTALLVVYALAVFGLFLLFYPVLSGSPVSKDFVAEYLRWFDSWVLTAG